MRPGAPKGQYNIFCYSYILCYFYYKYVPAGVTCGLSDIPANGFVLSGNTIEDVYFGDQLLFACHPGFIMRGEASVQCMSNGFWSSDVPTCRPDCKLCIYL